MKVMRLKVKSHFDAAHHLPGYKGKCSKVHGHRWEVEVELKVELLDKVGISTDFGIVKDMLNESLPDHEDLNNLWGSPTAENIAKSLYLRLKRQLPGLEKLTVWESPDCGIEYGEEIK